jgi:hypothetical protein
MSLKNWGKVIAAVALFFVLLALDSLTALQGLPILLILLGLVLLVTDRLRAWLQAHERAGLALLPFMAAALVLLLSFAKGRDLSQGILLLITLGLVFDILLVALAFIGEASKRGLRGALEFAGLTGLGLALGLVFSLVFLMELGRLGATSLAGP